MFDFAPGVPLTFERMASRVHPDDLALLRDLRDRARSDGADFAFEHRLRMAGDSAKYVHLVGHAIRDKDGHVEYMGSIQDVTERRLSDIKRTRGETALRRSEAFLAP